MFDSGQGNSIFGGGVPDSMFENEQATPALPGQTAGPGSQQNAAPPPSTGMPQAIIPVGGDQPGAPTAATAAAPMAGEWSYLEPEDTTPEAGLRSAGFTALLTTVAVGAGIAMGGPLGAAAGLLLAGAAANGYRAQKWWGSQEPGEKHEAVVSSVFAAAGIGVGGYMAYKAYQAKSEDGGAEED